jgi:hypothetical protein
LARGFDASDRKPYPFAAYAFNLPPKRATFVSPRRKRTCFSVPLLRSAASIERSRFRIPLAFTGTIPCQQHTKGKTMSENANKPVSKIGSFPITAAVWRNEKEGRTYYSVTLERSYKDSAGKWRTCSTFNTGDLLLLAKIVDKAHTKICELQAQERDPEQDD